MPPDSLHSEWQSVKRLLLISLLDQENRSVLDQVWSRLQQSLPQVNIALLAASSQSLPESSSSEQISHLSVISLPFPFSDLTNHAEALIQTLKERSFDAAIVFTLPQQSPYLVAYCCYLAGIPIRVGQSIEFGGSVLSHWIKPPLDPTNSLEYQLYLLQAIGLLIDKSIDSDLSMAAAIDMATV